MGGFGSGRSGSRRPLAEAMRRIDLTQLRRDHPVSAGSVVTMSYTCNDGRRIQATVSFLHTPTCFGGRRLWFCCPSCRSRCQMLYGSWRIACLRCHGLRYLSQSETQSGRANRGMFKIVKRLDPKATCIELPPKPRGMHWRTYERLVDRYESYDNQWAISIMRFLGKRIT